MRDELKPVRFRDREELHAYQNALLRTHAEDLAQRSPFYRDRLTQRGSATDGAIDITALPFTTKDDLARDNAAFLSVDRSRIIDHTATSGSLGAPVPLLLTERDLQRLAANERNSLMMAGVSANDTVQVMTTMDRRFMAGLAYFLGLREIGAGIVRSGPGAIAQQWELIRSCGTTAIIVVPSFILRLLDHARENGIDPNSTSVRKAICIGEPIRNSVSERNQLGRSIGEQWNIELFSTYASTEMATACTEMRPGSGHIVQQQLLRVEVIGEDDRPVADGGIGEVTVTPFHVEGMPLLRFRTGDVCTWHEGELPDGSFGQWLGPVLGRAQQRMKVKGTTIFPAHVIDVMHGERTITNFVILRERDQLGMDQLRILVNSTTDLAEAEARIGERLNVRPTLVTASDAEIDAIKQPAGSRKPSLFIDRTANN